MADKCYQIEEIPSLNGNEPHLTACGACRSLLEEYREFRSLLYSSLDSTSPLFYTLRQERSVESLMRELETLIPSARFEHIRRSGGITPGLAEAASDRAKAALFTSGAEVQQWLDVAARIIEELKADPRHFMPKDILWVEAYYLKNKLNLLLIKGRIQEAHALALKVEERFIQADDPFQQAMVARGLAFTFSKMGRPRQAVGPCLNALSVFRAHGARLEYLGLMNNLALVMAALGRPQRARSILMRVKASLALDEPFAFLSWHNMALVEMGLGYETAALRLVDELLHFSRSRGLRMEEGKALTLKGEIALLQKRFEASLRLFQSAEQLLREAGNPLDIALIEIYRAKALLALDQPGLSLKALKSALLFFTREQYGPDLIAALEAWEQAQMKAGPDLPQAAEHAFYQARRFNRLLPTDSSLQMQIN